VIAKGFIVVFVVLLCTGLPVGLQIVGPPGSDAMVLAEAAAFEAAHDFWQQVPRDAHTPVAVVPE
jgi:Asp-tRNA(Asn)/Glu-tRNA(Gln) amidotransferase A subunit family amidase